MSVVDRIPSRLTLACQQSLRLWQAPSTEQDQLRHGYLGHLDEHPDDGWSRTCPGAHLTASSLVVSSDRLVLLTLHAKLRRWLQTGGHIEADDVSLSAAAAREAEEESGLVGLALDPDPLLLSRHQLSCGDRPTFHLDVQFLLSTPVATPPVFGAESLDVRWFPYRGLPDVDTSVRDLVDAAARRLGWP
ncbi:MAG: NUDIX domain-containing protein [Propionibacteriaceae bacterium]